MSDLNKHPKDNSKMSLLEQLSEANKRANATGHGQCQMCGNILPKECDCNVCSNCLDESFPSEEDELKNRIKMKYCDKCQGYGNACTAINNHSICGLCVMEGYK